VTTLTLTLLTPPAVEPVSLSEAKAHCRVDIADDDDLITSLIVAARQVCETRIKRAFVKQTWELILDEFPSQRRFNGSNPGRAWEPEIRLPLPPLVSVASITYLDADGVTQTLVEGTDYQVLAGTPGRIVPAYGTTWPTARCQPGSVTIRFVAGYPGTNEIQQLAGGDQDGGTFTLTFEGEETAALDWDATAAEVQTALEALSNVGAGNILCTGGPLPAAPILVEFAGDLGESDRDALTADITNLTGGTPAITVTTPSPGVLSVVPESVKRAVLLLVGHLYENREAVNVGNIVNTLPFTVDALLDCEAWGSYR
jgi:uncharacterized phiE125 gp8 family phage protein